MNPDIIELYPYQDLKHAEILFALEEGHRDIAVIMPPSSGKTKTIQYTIGDLLIDEKFEMIIIIVPLLTIKSSWLKKINLIRPSNRHYSVEYEAENLLTEKLKNIETYSNNKGKIYIVSRAAIGNIEYLEFIDENNINFEKILVVADEGHHHVETTLAGKVCEKIYALGGTILKVTGTPWHNDAEVITSKTKTIILSNAEYARQVDPLSGKNLAPKNWEFRKIFVPYTSNKIEDIIGSSISEKISDIFKLEFIKSFLETFIEDNCPKAIVNIPRIAWAKDVIKELINNDKIKEIKGRQIKISNFTGDKLSKIQKQEIESILTQESTTFNYDESEIDIIISCSRMDEGTDWHFCSHVYNARIPDSPRQILQRWARAGRSKSRILNYPEKYIDTQSITFFIPQPENSLKEEIWEKYKNVALLMACYLEDFRIAEGLINKASKVSKYLEVISDEKASPSKIQRAKGDAFNEMNRNRQESDIIKASALKEVVSILLENGENLSVKMLQEIISSKFKKGTREYKNLLKAALDHISENDNRIKDELILLDRKLSASLIRDDIIEEFEKIAKKFEDLIIKPSDTLLERIAVFSANETKDILEAFKEIKLFEFTEDAIKLESEIYKSIHGIYPNSRSGSWKGFNNKSWLLASRWLLTTKGISLEYLLFGKSKRKPLQILDECLLFKQTYGRWPRSKDSIYQAFKSFRNHNPDLLKMHAGSISNKMSDDERLKKLREFVEIHKRKPNKNDKPYYNWIRELKKKNIDTDNYVL